MKKIFLSNLLLQLGLNLIIKPLYVFGVDRGVQNAIGKEAYGTYFSLLSFAFLLHTLNDFGIQNFTSSNVAKYPHLIQKYFPNLLVFKLILSSFYIVLTLIGAIIVGYDAHAIFLLSLLMLLQIISSFLLFFRANIAALGEFKKDSFLSIFDRILLLILGFFLLSLGFFQYGESAFFFIIIQIIALSLASLLGFYIIKNRLINLQFSYNPIFLRYLLKKGLPYALIVFLMLIYTRTDAVLIERLIPDGKSEAGIYASAYRLLEAVNSVMLIFGTLLLPMFSGMIGRKESIKELLQLSLKIVLFLSITTCVLVFYFRNDISSLLYKEATPYWADTMAILFLSYIPLSMMYVLGSLLTASGNLKQYINFNIFIVFFNLTANILAIPYYKAYGAAWVSLATQSIVAIGLIYLNFSFFKLKIDWKSVLQILIVLCAILGFTNLTLQYQGHWLIKILFAAILSFIVCAITLFKDIKGKNYF